LTVIEYPLPQPTPGLEYTLFRTFRFAYLEESHAMAHKKGQGSVKNGRDSLPKRRGIKKYAGEAVTTGSIILTQCGTRYAPGRYVGRARNDCLFALTEGTVYFDQSGKRVNVQPTDPNCVTV
jgi:large subunit ribosomal protein L27